MKKILNTKLIAAVLAVVIALGAFTACGKTATMVQRQNNNSNRGINIHDGL